MRHSVNSHSVMQITVLILLRFDCLFFVFAVSYLESNRAGIAIFRFMLDRTLLHMVFMVELSLFLWLMGKTIGIS